MVGGAYMPPFGMCAASECPSGAEAISAGDGQTCVPLNGEDD